MLHINDLVYRIAGRPIFEGATAVVSAGQRAGLVGRNGSGKSTLLRLVAGEGGYLQAEPAAQEAFQSELRKPLPDLGQLRVYGDTHLVLRTEPMAAALGSPPPELRYAPPDLQPPEPPPVVHVAPPSPPEPETVATLHPLH